MPTKFTVSETTEGYGMTVNTDDATYRVQANKQELRRLMIDLIHEFEAFDLTKGDVGENNE
jgi:hypothetical protein